MSRNQFSAILFFIEMVLIPVSGFSQLHKIQAGKLDFSRHEINWGLNYSGQHERDSWRTDDTKYYEKMFANTTDFFLENRFWDYTENLQQEFLGSVNAGPLWGKGNWNGKSWKMLG